MHVKKGDMVMVNSGADKVKKEKFYMQAQKISRVIVKGVNIRSKHVKP